MNKLTFLLSILKYSIINPEIGKQLLQSKLELWRDSKQKDSIDKYKSKQLKIEEIVRRLFPDLNYSLIDFQQSVKELQNHTSDFFNRLKNESYPSKNKPYPLDYNLNDISGLFLYILCKIIKPEKVVETGVGYGLSSMYILQAMNENKKGVLYSIDYVFRPWESKHMIGSSIPQHLRSNWNFVFGPSSQKLKKLLTSIGSIDVFFHDSLHTFKNMMFEFETVWPSIVDNGFLISDDISCNNAFYEFYSKLNLESFILLQERSYNPFLGIIKKP